MPLPALTVPEAILYKDSMTVYRQVNDQATGNPLGYKLAPVSSSDATPLQDVPCNFHATPNFDEPRPAQVGMAKRVNILTSNKITCQYEVLVESLDVILLTDRHGSQQWQAVDGDVKRPVLIKHGYFYGVPTQAPVILPGVWGT